MRSWRKRRKGRETEAEATAAAAAAARRVTFKTVLRNLSDLVYFRRYRCHARSVTVALNQQWHELSRGLRSRKAIYVTRENVNDSRSSSSMLSRSLGQFAYRILTQLNRASSKSRIYYFFILHTKKTIITLFSFYDIF